jgi:hypothetical protein
MKNGGIIKLTVQDVSPVCSLGRLAKTFSALQDTDQTAGMVKLHFTSKLTKSK